MSAARSHGARSQAEVGRQAGYVKQRLLQPLRLRQADLSPVERHLLNLWARTAAEVLLMERYIEAHGLIDESGQLAGFSATYYAARNASSRMLTKLEPRLLRAAEQKAAGGGTLLDRHLDEHYGKAKP